ITFVVGFEVALAGDYRPVNRRAVGGKAGCGRGRAGTDGLHREALAAWALRHVVALLHGSHVVEHVVALGAFGFVQHYLGSFFGCCAACFCFCSNEAACCSRPMAALAWPTSRSVCAACCFTSKSKDADCCLTCSSIILIW